MREEFFVRDPRDRSMRVQVEEHFELKDRIAFKYRFFVYDEKRQEDCTIILGTYEEANELLRKKGKLAETEKHYSLNALRDDDVQFFGEFRTLPSYEQTRELAIEIIQGNRLPRAPAESAKQAEEAK